MVPSILPVLASHFGFLLAPQDAKHYGELENGELDAEKKSNVYANHKRQEKTASHDMQICVL